jgi:opacity protein-like surface antigen
MRYRRTRVFVESWRNWIMIKGCHAALIGLVLAVLSRAAWAELFDPGIVASSAAVELPVGALANASSPSEIVIPAWAPVKTAVTAPAENVCPPFYLAAIIGPSFATLASSPGDLWADRFNQNLVTAGAAAGWAFHRDTGSLRVEFEARGRDNLNNVYRPIPNAPDYLAASARDSWSTMVNAWRDYELSSRFAVYAGGGLGAGGYRVVVNSSLPSAPDVAIAGTSGVSGFAWQAGGGVIYALNERISLDLGYRFLSVPGGSTDVSLTDAFGTSVIRIDTALSASEVLLSVRVFEPFGFIRSARVGDRARRRGA